MNTYTTGNEDMEIVCADCVKTKRVLEKAKEIIRFYADQSNWSEENHWWFGDCEEDKGKKARECLFSLEEDN